MKLKDSIAAKCRYGDVALRLFGEESELIWECSENDYQGEANILIRSIDTLFEDDEVCDGDEIFIHYQWFYGSCEGCDDWENRRLWDIEIMEEMIRDCVKFKSREELERYIDFISQNDDEHKEMKDAYYNWKNGIDYDPQKSSRNF